MENQKDFNFLYLSWFFKATIFILNVNLYAG